MVAIEIESFFFSIVDVSKSRDFVNDVVQKEVMVQVQKLGRFHVDDGDGVQNQVLDFELLKQRDRLGIIPWVATISSSQCQQNFNSYVQQFTKLLDNH